MAVYLWNWYPEMDGDGQVLVNGVFAGAMRREAVKKLAGIFAQGFLLETAKGQRIALQYSGALDSRIPSFAVIHYPEYRCKPKREESFIRALETDYCAGRLRPDSPLLFYLICMMAWQPERWKWSRADSWLMRRNHYYAARELACWRKEQYLLEMRKPEKLFKLLGTQEMLLELGSGEPFFLRRVYWKDAAGAVSDETNRVGIRDIKGMAHLAYLNKKQGEEYSGGENRPSGLFFCYICAAAPHNALDMAGGWTNSTKSRIRVKNVGKEPLCLCGTWGKDGYVVSPGKQYVLGSKELLCCETRHRSFLDDAAWLAPDFSSFKPQKKGIDQ